MANIDTYRFLAQSSAGVTQKIKIALPAIASNTYFSKTTDGVTGKQTYIFGPTVLGEPIFKAHLTLPVTIPVGISNLPLTYQTSDLATGYTVTDNMLVLPANQNFITFFRRSSNSAQVSSFFDTQRWITSSRETAGSIFAAGRTYYELSREGFDSYGGVLHTAYPGIRVNNTTGASVTLSSASAAGVRERVVSVVCFKIGV